MKGTFQVVKDNFEPMGEGLLAWHIELEDGYEICFEPLTFGRFYLAVYKDQNLIGAKIPGALIQGGDDE